MKDLWDWLRGFRVEASGYEKTFDDAMQNMKNNLSKGNKKRVIVQIIKQENGLYFWAIKRQRQNQEPPPKTIQHGGTGEDFPEMPLTGPPE